jgi:hypothetical protein
MSKRRTKPDETKGDNYGRWAVLTDCREPNPDRELWCGVIWQAILNVRFQVTDWQSSLRFLERGGNFDWICEQLGMEPNRASRNALKAVFDSRNVIHKH